MKKFLFFRTSSSSNGNNKDVSPSSTQEEVYWENPSENRSNNQQAKGSFSKARKQVSGETRNFCNNEPALRRSRSLSSSAFSGVEPEQVDFSPPKNYCGSPFSTRSGVPHRQFDSSFCYNKAEGSNTFEVPSSQSLNGTGRPGSGCSSRTHQDSSRSSSSTSSSNVSGKVLDRYIDGEQHREKGRSDYNSNSNFVANGTYSRPPRVRYASPSQVGSLNDKVSRDAKSSRFGFLSRDYVEAGYGNDSPRHVAKDVVERLLQSQGHPKLSKKELDHEMPVTLEDIHGNRCFDCNVDAVGERNYSLEEPFETINNFSDEDYQYLQKPFTEDYCGNMNSKEREDEMDVDLKKRSKEAEERAVLLSEDLEQESFFRDCGFDVPSLIQTIRNLAEERVSLALQVSSCLHSLIAGRASFKEERILAKAELESQTRRLEKEKNELQLALEKELDRRSSEWSSKLEKYQSEEHRLRERVRELAEQNVSLQREISSFNERDSESTKKVTYLEQQLKNLSQIVEDVNRENQDLKEHLSEVQESYRSSEDERLCLQNNFGSKESECKELHKSITRLVRLCSEQDKTITGLREAFGEEMGKTQSSEKSDKHVEKLQMEQVRLTGVELALRREIESYRAEADYLRHENINLLDRLKGSGKESDALTVRLDKEMWARVCCLQNQGLSMLNDSTQLCTKLLVFTKGKFGHFSEAMQGSGVNNASGLDGHFIVESEMKLQGLRRGVENIARSLQTVSSLLHDKSYLTDSINQSKTTEDAKDSISINPQTLEGVIRYELKAETLLTSLLREKLCSKEHEVEQLRAELATTVRGADILQSEVQNAMDNLAFVTHRLKDLEIQMVKKDESCNRLQSDLQDSNKELAAINGVLPKISEERDVMWNEVKQYRESHMLMNSQIQELKMKIESLEEEILLKEGQITILKDTFGSKQLDSFRDFQL